ncbi:acetylornithine aminotransferase, partial [Massospora cicadina]
LTTQELVDISNRYLLGVYKKPNIILHRGEGAVIQDLDGNKYLDMTAGIAVTSLGHGNADLASALMDQAQKIISTSNLFHNENAGLLAEKLVKSTAHPSNPGKPWAYQVFFTNSGTEATEAALKFARKVGFVSQQPTKYCITAFSNAFHGRTLGALSVTPKKAYQEPFEPLLPGVTVLPFNAPKAEILRKVNTSTCGVIVEPIQGEGGVHVADPGFLHELRARCNETGALLIYDEIQCGLGRTGKLWAHHHYGPECAPDLLTMAKPLGNGFPIGAVLVNERVAAALKVGDHGTTFGGNPLACKLGLLTFDRLADPQLMSHVKEVSELIISELTKFGHPAITEIRGLGLMLGVQINPDLLDASKVCEKARQRKMLVITAGVNALRLVPALVLTLDQARTAVEILKASIEAAYAEAQTNTTAD